MDDVKSERQTLSELAEGMDDFNRRLASIIENERLSTESKNLAIGLLVTLRAPFMRSVAAALRARAMTRPTPSASTVA